MKRTWTIAAVALMLGLTSPAAKAQILFQDNFDSDLAINYSGVGDYDPVIGAGDIGGSWTIREYGTDYLRTLNDTVPGNDIPGSDNFVSLGRLSSSRNSGAFASGWDPALTLNKVVQLDFNLWQEAPPSLASDCTVTFSIAAPPSLPGNSSGVNLSVLLDLDGGAGEGAFDSTWHSVRIMVNYDSSITQYGIAPQTYTFSIDGGTPTTAPFWTTGLNTVQTIGFNGGANSSTFYFDDVLVQVVPEPSAMALLALGIGALSLARRRTQ